MYALVVFKDGIDYLAGGIVYGGKQTFLASSFKPIVI